MGICLDTDATVAQDIGEQVNGWNHTGKPSIASGLANIAVTDLQSAGKIKFYPPKVPVLFVLGGPGSGKVTHCDTFMQERRGVTHINMMDLLQQYVMGNDMQDFSQLSSKTVTEVLMLEMKMAPSARAYLISGYPRSMRDAVEYSEKIQVVSGVILISWRKSVLEKQIDYGSKLGHVVLSLAKMELENFFKNVIPVADYFDQNDLLSAVNGERAPAEVYKDFRTAVLDILSSLENQEAILNGVTGMGRGVYDIPGSIVSVDTAPSQETNTTDVSVNSNSKAIADKNRPTNAATLHDATSITKTNSVVSLPQGNYTRVATGTSTYNNGFPPVIWVIGGPGSNKAMLCLKAVGSDPSWGHISVGRLLRSITDSDPRANTEEYTVKEALSVGEMAPEKFVNTMLDSNIRLLQERAGIIIDGYPRNLNQVKYFENKYKQRPSVILLDCSKLQLGRGRIDDTVSSFRRRLELFRELTLPMLKVMDSSSRLQIIDGDTDSPSVQQEFEKIIHAHISVHKTENDVNVKNSKYITGEDLPSRNDCLDQADAILHDLDNIVPRTVPTISNQVSQINERSKYRNVSSENHSEQAMDFKDILKKAEQYPEDSYI